jgi:CO/xanthine dehydrogenase Mo-binding subunit
MPTVGQAISRVDGPFKVTGDATYAYEHREVGEPLYGFIVGATIGRGRITRIDTTAADASSGVRLVMTHLNAPEQGTRPTRRSSFSSSVRCRCSRAQRSVASASRWPSSSRKRSSRRVPQRRGQNRHEKNDLEP